MPIFHFFYFIVSCNLAFVYFVTDDPTRSLSGLILKNNIRSNYKTIPSEVWTYIKQECLNGIGDQSPLIRTTICIIIRNILEKMGLHFWPELFPTLCEVPDSREPRVCEVMH